MPTPATPAASSAAPIVRPPRRLHAVPDAPLRIVDVAAFYGARSGGIRTYLDAKATWSRATGRIAHTVVVPAPGGREKPRPEPPFTHLPSLPWHASNGYRVPAGSGALRRLLAELQPDVVLLHDPFWHPRQVARSAHEVGARVVAVHHGSAALDAAALPGPSDAYVPSLRRWLRRAYRDCDAVMSAADLTEDVGYAADLPLRLGLHPAFAAQHGATRGRHVLYAGRLQRQKGVFALLEAAAASTEPYPLRFVGSGPAEDAIMARAERLGLAGRVSIRAFVDDPFELAALYRGASCVAVPGEHETFGLVGLEAAASGARVVACASAPFAVPCAAVTDTFLPGDVAGLRAAIDAARAAPRDLRAARAIAGAWSWPAQLEAETASLETLVA